MERNIGNKEADRILEVYEENERLRKLLHDLQYENEVNKAILDSLKEKGFEGEIKYIKFKIEEQIRKIKGW